jgi:hypothetical protein
MVGRILFLTFGSIILVAAWVFSLGGNAMGAPYQHLVASLLGVGFMLGGVACGAAEGGRARAGAQVLVPVQPTGQPMAQQMLPPQQQWPTAGPQAAWPQSAPPAQPPYQG